MIIKKLEVKGPQKKSAIIEFDEGLNVIAGASDTGKSYITKCFQFIFGAEKPPKSIEQAKGYTHIEVTILGDDGLRFLLSRELRENADITCIEIDNDSLATILKPSHKGKPNLSNFFLSQFNLDGKVLAKGVESMNHSALTLRILEKVFLVDEERIISEKSPIGKGQNTEKTQEISLLKTLLTGLDDSEIQESKKNKLSKESIRHKLENLEDFLNRFFPSEEDVNTSLGQLDNTLDRLENSYENAETELNDLIQASDRLVNERNEVRGKVGVISQEIADDSALIGRFNMLERKYLSDRERLEANNEAVTYIEQQKVVNCPVCGGEFEESDDLDAGTIILGNSAEILKINVHLGDLQSTVDSVQEKLRTNHELLSSTKNELSRLDATLANNIGNKVKQNRRILRDLESSRSMFRREHEQEKKRQEVLSEIGALKTQYDEILDVYQISDFSHESNELATKIGEILTRWDFPGAKDTLFNADSRDVVVGNKPRSHFGKGYRAICFSAVIIGLMEYLVPKGRHPGFVVLDSPLTTYRKQDEGEGEITNDEVFLANNMIYAFYSDLCDYYQDKQIIILDNQEPDEELHSKMNYTHFSHNENVGRYGFFPLN